MENIKKMLRLNLEIEGLLRIIDARDSKEAKELLADKFYDFYDLVNEVIGMPEVDEETEVLNGKDRDNESAECKEVVKEATIMEDNVPDEVIVDIQKEPASLTVEEDEEEETAPATETTMEETTEETNVMIEESAAEPQETSGEQEDTLAEPEETVVEQEDTVVEQEETVVEQEETVVEQEDTVVEQEETVVQAPASAPVLGEVVETAQVTVDEMISRREARNLNKAFTINDRFKFLRELFNNDIGSFNFCVNHISDLESLDEAYDYLLNELGWDPENEYANEFIAIVSKHFNEAD